MHTYMIQVNYMCAHMSTHRYPCMQCRLVCATVYAYIHMCTHIDVLVAGCMCVLGKPPVQVLVCVRVPVVGAGSISFMDRMDVVSGD